MKLQLAMALGCATMAFCTIAAPQSAQAYPEGTRTCSAAAASANTQNLSEAMERTLYANGGSYHRNLGIEAQFSQLFGLRYSDLEYQADAQNVDRLYRAAMYQQGVCDGVIRTRDLPNPFNSSLQQMSGN